MERTRHGPSDRTVALSRRQPCRLARVVGPNVLREADACVVDDRRMLLAAGRRRCWSRWRRDVWHDGGRRGEVQNCLDGRNSIADNLHRLISLNGQSFIVAFHGLVGLWAEVSTKLVADRFLSGNRNFPRLLSEVEAVRLVMPDSFQLLSQCLDLLLQVIPLRSEEVDIAEFRFRQLPELPLPLLDFLLIGTRVDIGIVLVALVCAL